MMLDAIRSFFQSRLAPDAAGPASSADRLALATCVLLLEAAHADSELTADEQAALEGVVRERFGLDAAQVASLLALADQERRQSTDLYQFTRLIAEHYDRSQKLAVLELLWRVVYSDGRLEAHEDALLHKFARLLDLRHGELIALKLKVKGETDRPGS
jgi:uncharacterized tellurite resistance protein B-like protein